MISVKNVLLFAVTATASVIQRDVAAVIASLEDIDTSTNTLTTTTNSWDGSIAGSLAIRSAEAQIEDDIETATGVANAEEQANSADSQTVLTYVTGTLTPDIEAALTAIINKKPQFQSTGLIGLVRNNLATLKSLSTDLGAALKNVAAADQQNNAQSAIDDILAAFDNAISDFA